MILSLALSLQESPISGRIEGTWEEGALQGECTYYYPDGSKLVGTWKACSQRGTLLSYSLSFLSLCHAPSSAGSLLGFRTVIWRRRDSFWQEPRIRKTHAKARTRARKGLASANAQRKVTQTKARSQVLERTHIHCNTSSPTSCFGKHPASLWFFSFFRSVVYCFDPSTRWVLSSEPLLPDPYESRTVRVGNSRIASTS